MKKLINWMKNEESGQGMVEYGLIIALVSIAVIAVLGILGGDLKEIFTDAEKALDNTEGS